MDNITMGILAVIEIIVVYLRLRGHFELRKMIGKK